MSETLQEWRNLLRSRSGETGGVRFGMFLEITQALEIDGATAADWQEWRRVCHDTNQAHNYVGRTLYQSSGGVR